MTTIATVSTYRPKTNRAFKPGGVIFSGADAERYFNPTSVYIFTTDTGLVYILMGAYIGPVFGKSAEFRLDDDGILLIDC